MLVPYRVLLPKRLFKISKIDEDLNSLILNYMQRYPHYVFLYEENGFAVCERREIRKDGEYE